MRVLVTGCAGFLGSHVCDALLGDGHEVYGVDNFSSRVNNTPHQVCLEIGDYCELKDYDFNAVVHCAALADIRYNHLAEERLRIWEDNIEGLYQLTEMLPRETHVIFMSTGAVYGDSLDGRAWSSGTDIPRPGSLYAASKVMGESLVQAAGFERWHNLRLCGLLGPRYHHGHVADFVEQAKAVGCVTSLDSGKQVKDYRDVRDVARIVGDLILEQRDCKTLNVGGQPWSIRDTVRVMGVDADWSAGERGWVGDPLNVRLRDDFGSRFSRTAEESCKDTLKALGWGT